MEVLPDVAHARERVRPGRASRLSPIARSLEIGDTVSGYSLVCVNLIIQ